MAVKNDVKVVDGTNIPSTLGVIYTATALRESINVIRFFNHNAASQTLNISIVESGGSAGFNKKVFTKVLAPGESIVPSTLVGEGLNVGDEIQADSNGVADVINVFLTVKQYTS
jgi:hypothetical protein